MECAWDDTFFSAYGSVIELGGQHRQAEGDPLRVVLSRLRVGVCLDEDLDLLNSTWTDAAEEWTDFQHLRARTCDAKQFNERRLAEVVGAAGSFTCRDEVPEPMEGEPPQAERHSDLSQVAADVVTAKVGARVVCKMSFGAVKTGAHGIVLLFVPEVSVSCKSDSVGEPVQMPFVKFSVMDAEEKELACRWQVPILLSWAVTVSRSQGMTIRKVAIDFSGTPWSLDGMVYSALSRAVSRASLRVRGLPRAHVKTSSCALAWYERARSERLIRCR